MADEQGWRLFPSRLRHLPADLVGVLLLVALTILAVFLPGVRETPLRLVLGLPFLLFLPGYAFVAALFPERGQSVSTDRSRAEAGRFDDAVDRLRNRSIGGVVRLGLSFGVSIAVTTLLGLTLNASPWEIGLVSVIVSVGGFTVGSTIVAIQRRFTVPKDHRFVVPYRRWYAAARNELFQPESRLDAGLNVLLIGSLLLAVAGIGYAVTPPQDSEQFTEFYLLTEDDGELVADQYPTNLTVDEQVPVVVGIDNHEHEPAEYTVVVQLQRVEVDRTGDTTTVEQRETLGRIRTELSHGETWRTVYRIAPTMTGRNLRLTFLLYKGDPPADPMMDNAYREVHLWVNVSGSTGDG